MRRQQDRGHPTYYGSCPTTRRLGNRCTLQQEVDDAVLRELESHGVCFHSIEPNNSDGMKRILDSIVSDLALVLHDKFYTEEAYPQHEARRCSSC